MLKTYRVENLCIQIPLEKLSELPCPFIAHLKIGNGQFSIVENASGDWVIRRGIKNRKIKEGLEEFLKVWSGAALILDWQNIQLCKGSIIQKLHFQFGENKQDFACLPFANCQNIWHYCLLHFSIRSIESSKPTGHQILSGHQQEKEM